MKRFSQVWILCNIYVLEVCGIDVKFIVDIPYHVAAPSIEELSIEEIKKYEDLSDVQYTQQEAQQFEAERFKYRISEKFRGWLIPSQYATVEQVEETNNVSSHRLSNLIATFRNTAFGKTEFESQTSFDSHVEMFILLNRAESPCECVNQQLFFTAYHMNRSENVFVSFAFWRPKWEVINKTRVGNADISEVKEYLKNY